MTDVQSLQALTTTNLKAVRSAEPVPDDRFQRLLPPGAWETLPASVRRRFSHKAFAGESVVYRGVTTELELTLPGLILAQAARLIGSPLPLDADAKGRPAIVVVAGDPGGGGQIWTRLYGRGAGFPQSVNSAKRFSGPTGLEEHVGGGVSMSLRLSVKDGALFFSSVDYFLTFCGRRFKWPRSLSPGRMVIGHHDVGGGAFAFTLTLSHPWFGAMISQTTIFHDMAEADHD